MKVIEERERLSRGWRSRAAMRFTSMLLLMSRKRTESESSLTHKPRGNYKMFIRCDFPAFNSYDDARNYYDRVRPWRGSDGYERPLDRKRSKRHVVIVLGD